MDLDITWSSIKTYSISQNFVLSIKVLSSITPIRVLDTGKYMIAAPSVIE